MHVIIPSVRSSDCYTRNTWMEMAHNLTNIWYLCNLSWSLLSIKSPNSLICQLALMDNNWSDNMVSSHSAGGTPVLVGHCSSEFIFISDKTEHQEDLSYRNMLLLLLVQTLVLSWLDHWSAPLAGLPINSTKPLHWSRIWQWEWSLTSRKECMSPLYTPYCLSIAARIKFKVLSLSTLPLCLQNNHSLCTPSPKFISSGLCAWQNIVFC